MEAIFVGVLIGLLQLLLMARGTTRRYKSIGRSGGIVGLRPLIGERTAAYFFRRGRSLLRLISGLIGFAFGSWLIIGWFWWLTKFVKNIFA
ncbi:MAG: hypothetical protein KJ621_19230 [Proteobacteria bacterium]|nr:hypothetical protein [Pseudomonadota bacterium]MBU1740733.1 hypothetical protein [Pseudomonadota bacterium]